MQGFSSGAAAQETTRTICFISLTSAVLACLCHFIVILWTKPGISRLFQGYLSLSSLITLIAFTLAYVKFIMRDRFDYDDPAETVGLIQSIIGLMISFVSLGQFFQFIHGLIDSVCFAKLVESSSDDENDDKNKNKDGDVDMDIIAVDEDEANKAAQQQHQETEEEVMAREIMENARSFLLRQSEGDYADDTDEDWSGLSARERAFKLVRKLSTNDPTFDLIKSAKEKERDRRRKKSHRGRHLGRRTGPGGHHAQSP